MSLVVGDTGVGTGVKIGSPANGSNSKSNGRTQMIEINEEERLFDDSNAQLDETASMKKNQEVKQSLMVALDQFLSKQQSTIVYALLFGFILALMGKGKGRKTSMAFYIIMRAIRYSVVFMFGAVIHDLKIHWVRGLSFYMNMVCAFLRYNDAKLWAVEDDPSRSLDQELQATRRSFEYVMSLLRHPDIMEFDKSVQSRTNGHAIPIRIFRPNGSLNTKLPLIYYIHGGGMICGSVHSHGVLCAKLADRVNCVVVSVDYRLTPEHRYPKSHHDCYDVLEFLGGNAIPYEEKAKQIGEFDVTKLAVAGDSAGATLAASVAMEAKQRNIHLCQQHLVYPCCAAYGINPTCVANTVTRSFQAANHGPMLTNRAVVFYTDLLFGYDRATAITSSLMGQHRHRVEGIAPAVIITARHDPLHDEGLLYAKYLTSLKVPVLYNSYNSTHGFWGIPFFDYGEEAFNFSVKHFKLAFEKEGMESTRNLSCEVGEDTTLKFRFKTSQ